MLSQSNGQNVLWHGWEMDLNLTDMTSLDPEVMDEGRLDDCPKERKEGCRFRQDSVKLGWSGVT